MSGDGELLKKENFNECRTKDEASTEEMDPDRDGELVISLSLFHVY